MFDIIKAYPFAASFELVNFMMLRPRTAAGILWPFESLRRHRHDANKLRAWLDPYVKKAKVLEVWTDEPIHFPMRFLHGMFPKAVHVKFPHSFNSDDSDAPRYRDGFIKRCYAESTIGRRLFWTVLQLVCGVRLNCKYGFEFDRAYTFDRPSPWSSNSVDLSGLVQREVMAESYFRLPQTVRGEVEKRIREATVIPGLPWTLVLLFGIEEGGRRIYRDAILRITEQHAESLAGCLLVVKPHPLSRNQEPQLLAKELGDALGQPVGVFDCTLNLDILWPVLPVKLLLAGPSGAVPVAKRVGIARTIVIRELLEHLILLLPAEEEGFRVIARDVEVW
jgi:hypothetical protein